MEVIIIAREYNDKRKESNRKWDSNNLDRLSIALPKGSREVIKDHAASLGLSVNQFISAAILRALGLDAWPTTGGVSADAVGGGVTSLNNREEEKDS